MISHEYHDASSWSNKRVNEISDGSTTRREFLLAVGVYMGTAPLFGCGGGNSATVSTKTAPTSAPQSLDITPTVTFDDTATPGLTTFYGELSDSSSPDPVFGFS